MPDLIAVAAYGKTQSLDNDGCRELYRRVAAAEVLTRRLPSLEAIDVMVDDIKQERSHGLRDQHQPVMTEEQWQAKRRTEQEGGPPNDAMVWTEKGWSY